MVQPSFPRNVPRKGNRQHLRGRKRSTTDGWRILQRRLGVVSSLLVLILVFMGSVDWQQPWSLSSSEEYLLQESLSTQKDNTLAKIPPLIPHPRWLVVDTKPNKNDASQQGTAFQLTLQTKIVVPNEWIQLGRYLAEYIQDETGLALSIAPHEDPKQYIIDGEITAIGSGIVLVQETNLESSTPTSTAEGYELQVTLHQIQIAAGYPAGAFYAIQTLRQLMLLPKSTQRHPHTANVIPLVHIRDHPEYEYRGFMLDVARHFFNVTQVQQCIDWAASFKFNHLHLHLTDDQGWRLEIPNYPNLTAIGGQSSVNNDGGGYYSVQDYQNLVQYAADRFVTIVPEMDMPGHVHAALVSYPEHLLCHPRTPSNLTLYTGTRVGFSSLCVTNERTYTMLQDIWETVAKLTPGPYLHMGGDESWATSSAGYRTFVRRIHKMFQKLGKQLVGWDEIARAEFNNVVVQFWNNASLAQQGSAKVILSPARRAYLDMKYNNTTRIGLDWAGTIEVDEASNWDATTYFPDTPSRILGVEAPLWTETVRTMEDLEYLVFPRLLGIAEIAWLPPRSPLRKWEQYRIRLGRFGKRLKRMGIRFYRSERVPWED